MEEVGGGGGGGCWKGFPRTDFRTNERLLTYLSKSVSPSL